MSEEKIRNENQVPYESLNWGDVYVQYPGIEGEFKFTLTDKAPTTKECLQQTFDALEFLMQKVTDYGIKVRAPYAVGSTVIQQQTSAKQGEPKQPSGDTESDGSFELDRLEYAPRPDGKVNANYFAPGMQWPTIYSARTKEQLSAMVNEMWGLQTDPSTFNQAGKLDVHGTVYWKNSDKKNSRGNPYKNIVRIEL